MLTEVVKMDKMSEVCPKCPKFVRSVRSLTKTGRSFGPNCPEFLLHVSEDFARIGLSQQRA